MNGVYKIYQLSDYKGNLFKILYRGGEWGGSKRKDIIM